jgi:hypothetical protein
VADEQITGNERADSESQRTPKGNPWYQRSTVHALKKQAAEHLKVAQEWDERENDETRLPMSEAIHFGGLVLTEAFTPSTVSSLHKVLESWPSGPLDRKQEWLEELARSRGGDHGGWQNLGVVRRPGARVMDDGHHDPNLPAAVDTVRLHLSFVTPALAIVVATFTITEDAGDLSELLRQDYRSTLLGVQMRVYGRFGDLRARIPWSRPARATAAYNISRPEDQKRRACDALMRKHEEACSRWFAAKFPGRFSAAEAEGRPLIKMLFTKEQVPYGERLGWLRPIGLDFALPLWRSTQPKGWWLSEERWPYREGRHVVTLAAKRSDADKEPANGISGESNWSLTLRFAADQAPLAAYHAMTALISLYAHHLGELRDKAGVRRFPWLPRRTVRDARNLDDYLIRDGLDAATVTSDLESLTRDLTRFRWGVPEFAEYRGHLRGAPLSHPPLEYVASLCAEIREQATRLSVDTTTTTGNVRASAELRQAVANTRLQRLIVSLSVAATVIAVISLLIAKH